MKIGIFARIIFGAVGLAGAANLFYNMPATIWTMGIGTVAFWLTEVGAINWGVVAITDDDSKDLLGLLNLKKK